MTETSDVEMLLFICTIHVCRNVNCVDEVRHVGTNVDTIANPSRSGKLVYINLRSGMPITLIVARQVKKKK